MAGEHALVHGVATDGLGTVGEVEVSVLHEGNTVRMHSSSLSRRHATELRLLLGLSLEVATHLGVTALQRVNLGHEFILKVSILLSVSSVLIVEEVTRSGGGREVVVSASNSHRILDHLLLDLLSLSNVHLRSLRVETRPSLRLSWLVVRTYNKIGVLASSSLNVTFSAMVSVMALAVG
jgi:hypothetical protein